MLIAAALAPHARTTTVILYLPTIAGSFVSATVTSAFGHSDS
jgi:hypothetical protein